jgi:hypothetical protein
LKKPGEQPCVPIALFVKVTVVVAPTAPTVSEIVPVMTFVRLPPLIALTVAVPDDASCTVMCVPLGSGNAVEQAPAFAVKA